MCRELKGCRQFFYVLKKPLNSRLKLRVCSGYIINHAANIVLHIFLIIFFSYLKIETIIATIPTTTSNDNARAILPPRTMNTISSSRQTRVRKTFQALHANLMIHSRQSKSPKTHIVKITNNVVNIVITSYFLDLHHSSNAMSSFFSWTCI